ncbi:MAG: UDP-N-acetylmuramate dehydrogenase [Parcubacteria group bacterium Gr01-1014_2]|nr:MAG: UDP-N-acetylmuramate dehydrogenase [Parcubacteria group bacterium Gr01-1014_2]
MTLKIGGLAKYFINVQSERTLIEAIEWARKSKVSFCVIGEGSNLIPNDEGFNGLIIKNEIKNLKVDGTKVLIGSGNNLLKIIHRLNKLGLAGMEKMAGIPGTVGGAIFGSAGAYGSDIKDYLVRVKLFDGIKIRWFSKKQCHFKYRESIFKRNKKYIILGAEFKLKNENPEKLYKISEEIIKLRKQKYRQGLLCPGSFFKNIVVGEISPAALKKKFLSKIPKEKVIYGKIPSGFLLETIGAKGMKYGKIGVAKHHGNLIYNSGSGKSNEVVKLAEILKNKVKKRFGINLEEEVQYL